MSGRPAADDTRGARLASDVDEAERGRRLGSRGLGRATGTRERQAGRTGAGQCYAGGRPPSRAHFFGLRNSATMPSTFFHSAASASAFGADAICAIVRDDSSSFAFAAFVMIT